MEGGEGGPGQDVAGGVGGDGDGVLRAVVAEPGLAGGERVGGGLVGAGGGFLIIPALVLFSKLDMKMAVGTSLLIIAANVPLKWWASYPRLISAPAPSGGATRD